MEEFATFAVAGIFALGALMLGNAGLHALSLWSTIPEEARQHGTSERATTMTWLAVVAAYFVGAVALAAVALAVID